NLQVGVDEHGRWSELMDGNSIGLALRTELPTDALGPSSWIDLTLKRHLNLPGEVRGFAAVPGGGHGQRRGQRRLLHIDLVFLVERLEKFSKSAGGFRRAPR